MMAAWCKCMSILPTESESNLQRETPDEAGDQEAVSPLKPLLWILGLLVPVILYGVLSG